MLGKDRSFAQKNPRRVPEKLYKVFSFSKNSQKSNGRGDFDFSVEDRGKRAAAEPRLLSKEEFMRRLKKHHELRARRLNYRSEERRVGKEC